MGFQSRINAMVGSVAGATFAIQKTLQQRQETANKKVEQVKQAKQKLRRNFIKDYLSKQPIAGGGTIGELPTDILKKIASKYSPAERKKLMDKEKMSDNGNKQ